MSTASIRRFGATAVPYTVSWTSEEQMFVARCPHARGLAIRQVQSQGVGKPLFGKPHSDRQRETIADQLCDLCGKPLKLKTKVSLSKARPQIHAAAGTRGILQVEPLLHRQCAAESIRWCPSLKRDIADGTLMVRQVLRHRVQFALMSHEYVRQLVPKFHPAPTDRIAGHAKVELLKWADRDLDWLMAAAPEVA